MGGDWRDVADRLTAEQDARPEPETESLFGRPEAALLLAIERANGGEFAPLGQVLVAYQQLFRSVVDPEVFALSGALLIDASLVEWWDGAFALLPKGRKLIRRSGSHWAADFPDRVAERLSQIDEQSLSPEGELPAPTADDVRAAVPGGRAAGGTGADGGAGSVVPTIGMQPGLRVTYERGWTGESVPIVPTVPTVSSGGEQDDSGGGSGEPGDSGGGSSEFDESGGPDEAGGAGDDSDVRGTEEAPK